MADNTVKEAKLISNLCFQIRDYAIKNHLDVDKTIQRLGSDLMDFSQTSHFDEKKGKFIMK